MSRSKKENFDALWEISGASVKHDFIEANGIKTSYIEAGSGSPLLLLHGAGLGSVVWYKVVKALSEHYRVICPDKPGYGESAKPAASYDRAFYTKWLRDFTQKLSLDKFDLVGNSQGGAVGMQYVLDYPEQVDRLVLSNTAGVSNDWSKWALGAVVGFHLLPTAITGWNLGRYMVWKPEKLDREWFDYSLQVVSERGGRYPIFVGMGRATSALNTSEIQKIKNPTLVLWGKNERLFPVWHAKKAHELIQNSQLTIIDDAGHMPFLDQSEAFIEDVMAFLQR